MNKHIYNEFIIEVYNDQFYSVGSADNINEYNKIFFGDNATEYPTSKHGVRIIEQDKIVDNCLIVGSGGATTVHEKSSLINKNQLVICCCNSLFCLSLPTLDIEWITVADPVTCFQVFEHNNEYIVHGEMQVAKLDIFGKIKWEFGEGDIFASMDNQEEFRIVSDGILLSDFAKTQYKIDFNGQLIWSNNKNKKAESKR